ncbi:MAG: PHP domain-containing protein, partial [Candidatus Kapabacteria bacterium]|nr:PHP domain-containing protein [Candidatus Kapabacteria bacterium]
MSDFVHLHNHSHYSLLDAACTPEQIIAAAKEDNQAAIALTDHGVMFGCYEFYKKAKKAGIKPIIGCEVYLATSTRFDKIATKKSADQRNYNHLVLLAKNDIGYQNLMKLVSLGHTEGFYYKPRIDRDLLVQYKDGLIALSACLAGVVNEPLMRGDYQTAYNNAKWF